MLYKLRIALASTTLALAAVSATADSASAGASGGGSFRQIVGSEPTSISGLRRAIMMLYGATPVLARPFGQAGGDRWRAKGKSGTPGSQRSRALRHAAPTSGPKAECTCSACPVHVLLGDRGLGKLQLRPVVRVPVCQGAPAFASRLS
jgi:hypothetical protein